MSNTYKIPKASNEIFASNLMRLMTEKQVDVEKMATDLCIDESRIRAWMKASSYPKYAMMIKLCLYFEYFDIFTLVTIPINTKPN